MAKSVFVPAGTGKQGSQVTQLLLEAGYKVHISTRDASSKMAKQLQTKGAVLHEGDLDSTQMLQTASHGMDAVFLALPQDMLNPQAEVTHAKNIIEAALNSGVKHFVYTSVARTGDHEDFPGWSNDSPMFSYWTNKATIEELVRGSGFQHWTILRPAFFMSNFTRPDVDFIFPELADKHQITLPYHHNTTLDLVNPRDIAKFAVAAIESPSIFSKKNIALASEKMTAAQIAKSLSMISGHEVTINYVNDDEAHELQKQGHLMMLSHIWNREVGYNVDIESLKQYNVTLTPLSEAITKEMLGW
jgi:uncharacterized protein YbjT (DUF2867 family)